MSLTAPLFAFWRFEISWRDLILISGGLFLLAKATTEIHDRLEVQQPVMMAAVVIAVLAMLVASKPLPAFINARPSLIILCLGFLLMIGLVLVIDGLGLHIPKGYVYAAIGFSVLIEVLNQLAARGRRKWAEVLALFGRIPAAGERVAWDGWEFQVLEIEGRRVARLAARRRNE